MDTRRLQHFVQIIDCGSITKAAIKAGVAQPALSQQLAALESELKAKLLYRSSAGVKPTPAGEALYRKAQLILRQMEDLQNLIRETADGLSGRVVVGVPQTLIEVIGVPLLTSFTRDHPKIQLRIREEGASRLLGLLETGEVDLALSPRRPGNDEILVEQLFIEPLVVAFAPNLRIEDGGDLHAMARLPWITAQERNASRALVESAFAQAGLNCRVVAEIEALSTMIRVVQLGLGVAVLPLAVAGVACGHGDVRTKPFGSPPLARPMFLCSRRSSPLSRVALFTADMIRALAAQHEKTFPTVLRGMS